MDANNLVSIQIISTPKQPTHNNVRLQAEYSIIRDFKQGHTMATQPTDREWKNAVIGTVLTSSLIAILLGVFQLAEGEAIGFLSIFIGASGVLLLFFLSDWSARKQELRNRISQYLTSTAEDNPHSTLQEQYARGDIDLAEFDRRLRRLQAPDADEDRDNADDSDDRDIISRRN
jgi:uncharacterized membrane protein